MPALWCNYKGGTSKRLTLVVGRRAFVEGELAATEEVPVRPALFQNYPNPFNRVTTIRYGLAEASAEVILEVYDVLGKRVATLVQREGAAGYHAVVWDGRNDARGALASGVYFLRMRAGSFVATRTMLFVK